MSLNKESAKLLNEAIKNLKLISAKLDKLLKEEKSNKKPDNQ